MGRANVLLLGRILRKIPSEAGQDRFAVRRGVGGKHKNIGSSRSIFNLFHTKILVLSNDRTVKYFRYSFCVFNCSILGRHNRGRPKCMCRAGAMMIPISILSSLKGLLFKGAPEANLELLTGHLADYHPFYFF